jgi:hypothetical protein
VRPTLLATPRHGRDINWQAERKYPDFPILTPFRHPRAKLLLSRKPNRQLESPGETAATEPLNWLKEQPCDSWAIGNLGSSSHGIQPAREVAGIGGGDQLSVVSCQLSVVGCRVSGLICQPGAKDSSRPTGPSATGPAGAHDTAAAGNNFTADTATIRSMARAYDGLAAHRPGRQRPPRGDPAPPDPRHPPLGDSVDPPADRLPDPHATAAPAHPRSGREPGFELRFKPWHWPQHQPPRCRSAAISVRRRPPRSIDVSHASKIRPLEGARASGTRELGARGFGDGYRLFSQLTVEVRAPGFRVARVAVVRGENWPSKSPH